MQMKGKQMSYGRDSAGLTHGVMVSEFSDASIARVLDTVGYDFLIVDCEHGAFDYSQVSRLCAVAAGINIDVLVRIPEIRREHIGKYLDMGAAGLVVPMVSTAEEAEQVIQLAKYAPLGSRGVSVTRAHSGYHVDDLNQYLEEANRYTKIFVQLETVEAFENVREIAAVEGLTGLFVGPNDLLQDLGVPGKNDDPRLADHIEHAAYAAHAQGLESGIITSNGGLISIGVRAGMRVVCQGSDVSLLMAGARAARADLKGLLGTD